MTSRIYFKQVDHDGDMQEISVEGGVVNDGATYTTVKGLADALSASLNAVTLGGVYRTAFLANESILAPGLPASAAVQTNIQWLARFHATADGAKRTLRLPCADLSLPTEVVPQSGGGGLTIADMSQAPWVDFKTNFEAYVKINGGSVVLDSVEFLEP